MKRNILLCVLLLVTISLSAQEYSYKFRLLLKDKGETSYSLDRPNEFLSQRAIDRRNRQDIKLNATDLPISDKYIKDIEALGAIVVAKSKWLRTISVHCADSSMVDQLKTLPFVANTILVWKDIHLNTEVKKDTVDVYRDQSQAIFGEHYGMGYDNLKSLNGTVLHNAGFTGKGLEIAVIDAGFNNFHKIELLNNVKVKGYKGFVYGNEDLFINKNQHGLNVLSCIAANKPMHFVGTAPDASFWLLGSEDSRTEFPIEEDYWMAAIEYADSVGVDVVNTSLGYNEFDAPTQSFKHSDLDGKTAFISRAATMAVLKGMAVVCSAGNSGDGDWRKITPPSDAEYVLTVGAMRRDSIISSFSSKGYSADMRVKPDVVALGSSAIVVDQFGILSYKSGTSFSSPIMSGMVASLWQGFPELTSRELLQVVRESANRYEEPSINFGYGIPNMEIAMEMAKEAVRQKGKNKIAITNNFRIESDAIGQLRIIVFDKAVADTYKIVLTKTVNGKERRIFTDSFADDTYTKTIKASEKYVYNLTITGQDVEDKMKIYF